MIFIINTLRTKYNNLAKLLFTDADTLVYEIETNGVHEDFNEDQDLFDFSDYPKDSKFLILSKKKLLAKSKMNLTEKLLLSLLDKSQQCILWLI